MDTVIAKQIAKVTIEGLSLHAKELKGKLSDDMIARLEQEHGAAHMAAINTFAALPTVIDDIEAVFCRLHPQVDKVIEGFGFFANLFFPAAVALLNTFKTVLDQVALSICPAVAKPV